MLARLTHLSLRCAPAVVVAGFLGGLAFVGSPGSTARGADPEALVQAFVTTTMRRMPLTERASHLVMTSIPGTRIGPRERRQLRALQPGGIIVFSDNVGSRDGVRRWTRAVDAVVADASTPGARPVIAVDQEGGSVRRLPWAGPEASHPQLGRADRVATTARVARETARQLMEAGIDLDLAPVADLDLAPAHVMRSRSFGPLPDRVARHVRAFVTGLHEGGAGAAVKHFPGFGGASSNSDDAVARIGRTRQQLERDLVPFRAAVEAGVDAVMMSHGVYAVLDRRHPATLSPVVYAMLRRDVAFRGLIVTDSLDAIGFRAAARMSAAAGCARAVAAGADMVLVTGDLDGAAACRSALVRAVRAGDVSRTRLDDAVRRVLTYQAHHGLLPGTP